MDELTAQQRDFVERYLACWNGAQAAREAKYSPKTARMQASRLLTNVNIQAAIQERLNELKMSADEVLKRLADEARGTIADVLSLPPIGDEFNPDEHKVDQWKLDLKKAQETGAIHQIKKIKMTKDGPEVEMYDAHAARVKLGEHHRLFGKAEPSLNLNVTPDQLEQMSDDELDAHIERLRSGTR